MRVLSRSTLEDAWKKHADAEQPLKAWYHEVKNAKWQNFNEIREEYPSADVIRPNRVCFNIKGNRYRLIVAVKFDTEIVYIRFFGTHAEYDKVDASTI